ncbi:hypothetical protein TNCV_3825501 [Trichonephila clavipes]|nr:hypothetical protein TNCV_3825501 [Trichonephila clavipes]
MPIPPLPLKLDLAVTSSDGSVEKIHHSKVVGPVWNPRFETAHSTACLRPVRKAILLIRVSDSWSASPSKTLEFSYSLPQMISPSLFRALFSSFFSFALFFLRSPRLLKKNPF